MDTRVCVPQHPQDRPAGAQAGGSSPKLRCPAEHGDVQVLRQRGQPTGQLQQLQGQEVAVLPGRLCLRHGEGMVPCTAQAGRSVCEEGLFAVPEQCAVNMGAEWRCGGEVWGYQTCFHAPWAPGHCHGARQGMGCFSWDPEMGKCPVLAPSPDPKPGTGCQALQAGMAHPGATPAGPCPMAVQGDAGDKVPPRCPPRLCRPGR